MSVNEGEVSNGRMNEIHNEIPPAVVCAMLHIFAFAPALNRNDFHTRRKRYGWILLLWCDHKMRGWILDGSVQFGGRPSYME